MVLWIRIIAGRVVLSESSKRRRLAAVYVGRWYGVHWRDVSQRIPERQRAVDYSPTKPLMRPHSTRTKTYSIAHNPPEPLSPQKLTLLEELRRRWQRGWWRWKCPLREDGGLKTKMKALRTWYWQECAVEVGGRSVTILTVFILPGYSPVIGNHIRVRGQVMQ
jgi:hypothetical protein